MHNAIVGDNRNFIEDSLTEIIRNHSKTVVGFLDLFVEDFVNVFDVFYRTDLIQNFSKQMTQILFEIISFEIQRQKQTDSQANRADNRNHFQRYSSRNTADDRNGHKGSAQTAVPTGGYNRNI